VWKKILLINFDLLAFIWSNFQYNMKTFIGPIRQKPVQYGYFRIGPIPVSPIATRSESARHLDNCKEKSREILNWLINKSIITWWFSYWPSYRSSVSCIGVRLRLRPILLFQRAYFQYFRQLHYPYFFKRSAGDDHSDTESEWTVCTVSFVNERKQIMWRHAQNVLSLIGLGKFSNNSTFDIC
jgi:hypothetical protein